MKLRSELFLYTFVLTAFNLILAFGAIGLFARMGPAIERIIQENVVSIDSAEQILAEFAALPPSEPAALPPEARERVRAAIQRAADNVTEAEETPVVQAIRDTVEPALQGDPRARAQLVDQTRALIAINRRAMTAVDWEARRLGAAGAWAAVFIGALSFAFSLLVIIRLRGRVIQPLLELHGVLGAARAGDRFRRCRLLDAPLEIKQACQSANQLLDERYSPGVAAEP